MSRKCVLLINMLCSLMTFAAVEDTVQSEMGIDLDW